MKKIILILFIISSSYASEINQSLFDGVNTSASLLQIEKDINNTISQKLKNPKLVQLEISTLKKLKQLYEIKDEIKAFEIVTFSKQKIKESEYLKAFYLLGELQNEIKRLEIKNKSIQEKLFALKTKIEKTLPSDANNSLLINQMEYAFYKISQNKIAKSLKHYKMLFKKEFNTFQEVLPRVDFQKQSINIVDNKIDSLNKQSQLLIIDKDSEALRDKKDQEQILKKEKKIQKETDAVLTKKLQTQISLSLKELKHDNQKQFLKAIKQIESDIELLSEVEKEKFDTLSKLLSTFGNTHFNTTSITLAKTELGVESFSDSVFHFMNKTLFVYEEKAFSIKTILIFLITVLIGFILAKFYNNIVDKYRKLNTIKSLSTARMVANSGYYLIIFATFFISLKIIGLDMHTIFLIIGALLLWVSLGLQGFISNYAMGILLKINRSIRIGDYIELDSKTSGVVDDMDFRSVIIITDDNVQIIIPNSKFISDSFINQTLGENIKRIHITFDVDKDMDYSSIQKEILTSLNTSKIPHIKDIERKAQVIICDINREIVRYSLLVWVKHHNSYDQIMEKSAFLALIHQSLKKVAL